MSELGVVFWEACEMARWAVEVKERPMLCFFREKYDLWCDDQTRVWPRFVHSVRRRSFWTRQRDEKVTHQSGSSLAENRNIDWTTRKWRKTLQWRRGWELWIIMMLRCYWHHRMVRGFPEECEEFPEVYTFPFAFFLFSSPENRKHTINSNFACFDWTFSRRIIN